MAQGRIVESAVTKRARNMVDEETNRPGLSREALDFWGGWNDSSVTVELVDLRGRRGAEKNRRAEGPKRLACQSDRGCRRRGGVTVRSA